MLLSCDFERDYDEISYSHKENQNDEDYFG